VKKRGKRSNVHREGMSKKFVYKQDGGKKDHSERNGVVDVLHGRGGTKGLCKSGHASGGKRKYGRIKMEMYSTGRKGKKECPQ